MEKLGLNVLREKYLEFFESKGHLRQKSFPLVPQGDSSLLLINSGMAPLKPYFSGEAAPPRNRMTTCQKCIRTPDIERVGKTSRHGTFFEMLGNFSFGDYFKREAIRWAWEFITEVLEIPEEFLYVTVYLDDDEAAEIWEKEIGVDPTHISRLGKADNFWEIGSGPCGPCSEIYFDRGEEYSCGSPDCKVGCDCDRYVEFWNLVFTQFHNDGNDNYTELASKNIDTGMGLERIACIMQGVQSLFDVDTVMNITKHVSEITGASYGTSSEVDVSLRIITDHIRSTTMLICDGVLPSNEGRGYVLRRLLRRAARHGKLLGVSRPFLYEVCETVIKESSAAYPELLEKKEFIVRVIKNEEEQFSKTIDSGLSILGKILSDMEAKGEDTLSGADCFRLYDTFGFPIDLTVEILEERGLKIDRAAFDSLMKEQRDRARSATAALGDFAWTGADLGLDREIKTEFTGYTSFEEPASILAVVSGGKPAVSASEGDEVVIILDKTPFYAEAGGQITDTGRIFSDSFEFEVKQVTKSVDGKYLHAGVVVSGEIIAGETVTAKIDWERREAIMRAHSSTHLLHRALKEVLGTHVEQAGSLVSPDHIRFDFTHFSALSPQEIARIDDLVNNAILSGYPVTATETSQDKAREMGAVALFGEKYGDVVRVIKMGEFSLELCGGTHLDNTAKAGSYRTLKEFSVASGVRRIEAVVGKGTLGLLTELEDTISLTAEILKADASMLQSKASDVAEELKTLKKEIEKLRGQGAVSGAESLLEKGEAIGGVCVVTGEFSDISADELRKMGDYLRDKKENIVAVLSSVSEDKISFLAVCGKAAVEQGAKAGELVKLISAETGGSGGGKNDSAMGGGKDPAKVKSALALVRNYAEKTAGV